MTRRYRSSRYNDYPEYVPVSERKAKAALAAKKLRDTNPDVQPVIISGKQLAQTWWGKAWNDNLERYSDFSNRLPRGRSYVRHGAVIHLEIQPGRISSRVQGTRKKPYEVEIKIDALDPCLWDKIVAACAGKLDSARELLEGKFPKALTEIFTEPGKGLFPTPKEIDLDCSCPDWAVMCKHVAATLYGIGARLDENPNLFFILRKVDPGKLVTQAVQGTARTLVQRAGTTSDRILQDADLENVFGIDMDGVNFESNDDGPEYEDGEFIGHPLPMPEERPSDIPRKSAPTKKRTTRKSKSTTTTPNKPLKSPGNAQKQGSILEQILAALASYSKGANVKQLANKTKLKESQVRNAIARAMQQGHIDCPNRGIYRIRK